MNRTTASCSERFRLVLPQAIEGMLSKESGYRAAAARSGAISMRHLHIVPRSLAVAAVIVLTTTLGANAQPERPTSTVAAFSSQGDVSAVRKKKARRNPPVVDSRSPYYRRRGVAPSFGYIGPPGYAGEYAWRKSIGQCVEDLGYGRWAACGHR